MWGRRRQPEGLEIQTDSHKGSLSERLWARAPFNMPSDMQ